VPSASQTSQLNSRSDCRAALASRSSFRFALLRGLLRRLLRGLLTGLWRMLLSALLGFFARFWYALLSSTGIDLYSPLSLLRTAEALDGTSNRRRGQWCDSESESVGAQRDKQSPALQWNTTYLDPAPRSGLGGVHPNATHRDETLCLERRGPSRSCVSQIT